MADEQPSSIPVPIYLQVYFDNRGELSIAPSFSPLQTPLPFALYTVKIGNAIIPSRIISRKA